MPKIKINMDEIEIFQCGGRDLSDIMQLQEDAFSHIKSERLLRRNDRDMLKRCLFPPHTTLGVRHNGKLIAFGILYCGGKSDENLGYDAQVPESELLITGNIKLVIVKSEYWGNGLQRFIIKHLETAAKSSGIKHLCATVSPENIHSVNNFKMLRYQFLVRKTKYDGHARDIFYKSC